MASDPLIGQVLNNIKVEQKIGRGGMAMVYRARDQSLDRPVALKLIRVDTSSEPTLTKRLLKEARTIARLRHPNIVGIYQLGTYDDMNYMVMEYVDGPTLSDILNNAVQMGKLLDYRAVLTITACVVSALDYAHALGVIHRDIKPSNIMVDRRGTVFLTDFGLALRLSDGTEGKAFGSPHYISPEQVSSSSEVTPRSDLYSLGVVIYRMLTGRLPFEGKRPVQVAMKHITELPAPPSVYNPDLPLEVDMVLLKALAKNPAERFWNGSEFQRKLALALGLNQMSTPIYQPLFLASTWTAPHFAARSDETFSSPTYLLEDETAREREKLRVAYQAAKEKEREKTREREKAVLGKLRTALEQEGLMLSESQAERAAEALKELPTPAKEETPERVPDTIGRVRLLHERILKSEGE